MSINNSYFSKNNTIVYDGYVNTGRNPVMELFYGNGNISESTGYSRFIFDLDLELLNNKIQTGLISTNCNNSNITHTLKMTNTSYFNKDLLNTSTPNGRLRATSFDLILFRIPPINFDPSLPQIWDEGVGYDYYDVKYLMENDKNYSNRPSNWYQTTTIGKWGEVGIYNNLNLGGYPFTGLTIIDVQHFQFGDENIEFDMTNEINSLLSGGILNHVGWGISYLPQVELLTGTESSYSVGFFTRHTQTFYEPFLETKYDDLIQDDRNYFTLGKTNKLYLYVFEDGNFMNLDKNPLVTISDSSGTPIQGLINLSSCIRTQGVYEIIIPPLLSYKTPCIFTDTWSDVFLNGIKLSNVINDFTIYPTKKSIQIGTSVNTPQKFGFDYYGILQNEKIMNSDIRKVVVIIKESYTTNKLLPNVDASYRVYVKEGQTEVMVQEWTKLNRTPNEYYFMFDTRDKIPNEYFIDIQVKSMGQINTYKKQIQFQIINKK